MTSDYWIGIGVTAVVTIAVIIGLVALLRSEMPEDPWASFDVKSLANERNNWKRRAEIAEHKGIRLCQQNGELLMKVHDLEGDLSTMRAKNATVAATEPA